MAGKASFFNLRNHGFIRVATATPKVALASPLENAAHTASLIAEAVSESVDLVVFPELGLSGYTLEDLHFQDAILDACVDALTMLRNETANYTTVAIVGLPLRVRSYLFNVAAVLHQGEILGIVPKAYLPNYREFYEARQFTPGILNDIKSVTIDSTDIPFGTDLIFTASDSDDFRFHIEICEDVWVPVPPSSHAAMAGAQVLVNLSASNVTVGKSDYRHALCRVHSQRTFSAYLYSAAGNGESTTDLAWDGHAMIYENGVMLAQSERFATDAQLVTADVDLELLRQERMRHTTFADCAARYGDYRFRFISFKHGADKELDFGLRRAVDRFPYVPNEDHKLDELCFEAYNIQVAGLAKRLAATGIERIVIGISGGLDSTQALLVAVQVFDQMGLPRKNILAYTLPAFATSAETRKSAWALMNALGVTANEIDMEPVSLQTLKDIGHPFADGEKLYDVTFENVQAGARTATLFRLANQQDALVLGTGDLSELALGWCTYGVGDHMSHYNVNGSVSKTLIQHLIRWVAAREQLGRAASDVLLDILNTEISPELVPGDDGNAAIQSTQAVVGPYPLQDFSLYHFTRHSFRPSKVAFLAYHAWQNAEKGQWPPHIGDHEKIAYDLPTIKKWTRVFLWRFFQTSQFKRSAVPNGPKVASGGSLSPRGDWRAPSDNAAKVWLDELDKNVP